MIKTVKVRRLDSVRAALAHQRRTWLGVIRRTPQEGLLKEFQAFAQQLEQVFTTISQTCSGGTAGLQKERRGKASMADKQVEFPLTSSKKEVQAKDLKL